MTHTPPPRRLSDRAVIALRGPDARSLLQGLVTQNLDRVSPDQAAFAALLSPQGKILAEMVISADGADGLWLDTATHTAADLHKRLKLYKLRATVELADCSDTHGVGWTAPSTDGSGANGAGWADPRGAGLGQRQVAPLEALDASADEAWRVAKFEVGLAECGPDFAPNQLFPADVNMDLRHGVDFKKGCFIGQEVVSRMKRKGGQRKRTLLLDFDQPVAPGAALTLDDLPVGETLTTLETRALAVLRVDRIAEAQAWGETLKTADGARGRIVNADWLLGQDG
ncbi:MAG: YgfZ/GcvT domain-containing protein [Maricaulaceae bacterium]